MHCHRRRGWATIEGPYLVRHQRSLTSARAACQIRPRISEDIEYVVMAVRFSTGGDPSYIDGPLRGRSAGGSNSEKGTAGYGRF